jgi:ComF family protein
MKKVDNPKNFASRIVQASNGLLDYVFMPHCLGCQIPGVHWCADCNSNINSSPDSSCRICQSHVIEKSICSNCEEKQPYFDQVRSLGRYEGPLAKAIVALKYHPNRAFGEIVASKLAQLVRSEHWTIDLILAMPQSRRSFVERGYNQVEMFSKPLSRLLGVKHGRKQIQRKLNTRSQVGLDHYDRYKNVRNAFTAEEHLISGMNILLVDDVITSGASLNFAAKAIRGGLAKNVYAVCLARADIERHNA